MSLENQTTWTCGECLTIYEFKSPFDGDMPDDWFCIEDRGCHYVVCSLKCLKDFVRTYENGVEPTDPVRASASAASTPQEANPRCVRCGGPHPFDTVVPSVRWNAVIREAGWADYLCATCVLTAFARAGQSFTAQLWGDEFDGLSVVITIGGQPAIDAALVSEENTKLRADVAELRAALASQPSE